MSTSPSEQRKAEQKGGRDDLVQYIEELAGLEEYPEGDTWISLTDAARITRTSEAMTRRWVTSGRLKVKKEPVGVPPRTRLVRLSDVAKIRPIVDPTAAITGEVRKLDLPSIPRQQLQIMEEHQRLTKLMQEVLEASKQHEASTHTALLEVTAKGEQQAKELQHALDLEQQQREALAEQLRDQAHQLEQSSDQLAEQGRQHQHDVEQLRTHLLGQLTETRAALERQLSEQGQEYRDQVDGVRRDLTQQQEALTALRQDMTTLIEQQVREVLTALEQLARDQAHDVATLTERLETLEQRIEQVAKRAEAAQITVLGYQQHADTQDQVIAELRAQLQEEAQARQRLSTQVASLFGEEGKQRRRKADQP
jgi:chromosome segregation ATPase